ncbi:helix-turn-helix transcriptional regulator [Cohnella sp. CBP 2801]|uniref:Helix-turn-helix transcriptional regulator n=2 Tax=Cohnella zeiphila TaxID=2761120 RepID=A0A7X0SHV7_9BACL|nr:helix-turn-helix transcriptional regulator [Cohnella zeiphila]
MRMLNSFIQTDGVQVQHQQLSQQTFLGPIFQSFAKRHGLTPRETQVLRLLVIGGLRNDELAKELHISPKTLKNHLACMMKKTNTGSSRTLQAMFFNHTIKMLLPSV